MSNKGIAYMTGMAIGLEDVVNGEFDILAPYSGCWICGELFQSPQDRAFATLSSDPTINPSKLGQLEQTANSLRDAWRTKHSDAHSQSEHEKLARSPDICTPEAAYKLAPFGIFPIDGSKEVFQAMQEAPRAPV